MVDIITVAESELKKRGAADAAALAEKAVSGDADNTAIIDQEIAVPTWRQRDYSSVSIGTPYKWNGQVYKLLQQHDATNNADWSPDKAVSLWDICHTKDPKKAKEYVTPQGTRGMYDTDECCTWNGHVYKSKQDDLVYNPTDLSSAWEDLGTIEEVQKATE